MSYAFSPVLRNQQRRLVSQRADSAFNRLPPGDVSKNNRQGLRVNTDLY